MFANILEVMRIMGIGVKYATVAMFALTPVAAVIIACNRKKFEQWLAKHEPKAASEVL